MTSLEAPEPLADLHAETLVNGLKCILPYLRLITAQCGDDSCPLGNLHLYLVRVAS